MKSIIEKILELLMNQISKKVKKLPPKKEVEKPITWIESPNHSSRKHHKISAIIIHHTGKGGLKAAVSWFKSKDSQVSAHYIIDKDGTIYQMVKEDRKAWHAGRASLHGNRNVNAISIGIELVGAGKVKFTDAQYDSLAHLCRKLKKKYKIPDKNIVGHKDVAPKRKVDPKPFDNERFFKLLNQ